jgi:myo-inositol-1(or 4)-monophosphatase
VTADLPDDAAAPFDTTSALAFAAELVADCGRFAAGRQESVVEEKKSDTASLTGAVVTEVDREVERRVEAALTTRFPDDAVIGEEFAHRPGSSGRTWQIDPVDGTLNYARRLGPWSVVVSAWVADRCELVAVWTQGAVYTAARGHGAFRDGQRLRLPADAVERGGLVRAPGRLAPELIAAGWLARSVDSSATELCQVADGRITGTIRLGGHPRDLHGPALLVEEAGGRVTDLDGGPWTSSSPGLVAAAEGAHAGLLTLVPTG